MMFLIRTAFWLTILILLLPSNEQEQRQVYGTAEAAVQDLRGFCGRNPGVCESSKDAFATFSQKAQFGAKMLMDFVKDRAGEQVGTGYTERGTQSQDRVSDLPRDPQGTLTDEDLKMAWSAPKS